MATVTLIWEGPFTVGTLPDVEHQSELTTPHIYFVAQQYSQHTSVYIGQSKNLLSRLQQHIQYTLALRYWVRDHNGECIYHPAKDSMFDRVNKISEFYPLVIEDLKRWNIAFAPCDVGLLDPVESQLIRHLLDQFPYDGDQRYWCDNGRRQSDKGITDLTVSINLSNINETKFNTILTDCFAARFHAVTD